MFVKLSEEVYDRRNTSENEAEPGKIGKHVILSMPLRNRACFCRVAEAYFASWRQNCTLETLLPVWINWETLGKHARATNVLKRASQNCMHN